jgi:hypothetical protein
MSHRNLWLEILACVVEWGVLLAIPLALLIAGGVTHGLKWVPAGILWFVGKAFWLHSQNPVEATQGLKDFWTTIAIWFVALLYAAALL